MALINCPDCNKEVSEHAPTCPNCGRPLKEVPKSEKEIIVEKNKEGCFLQTLNCGCLIVVTIIVFIVVIGILGIIK